MSLAPAKSRSVCRTGAALLFLLISFTVTPLAAANVEHALGLLWSGKIKQGMAELQTLAEGGDVRAQLFLGNAYARENSIVKHPDYRQAMKWFQRASSQGSGEGSAAVAELFEQGHGVAKSSEKAKAWWELAAKQGYDQQELEVRCFIRKPGPPRLACKPLSAASGCPTPAEMAALRDAGITGTMKPTGGGVRHRMGPKARALIILDHRITSEVRLNQPRHAGVIYIQQEAGWLRLPPNVPLLDRPIILSPQPDAPQFTLAGVQDVDGSTTSSGCATWK